MKDKTWIKIELDNKIFRIKARDYFWADLIYQELCFWFDHQETYTYDDFDGIVKRRGFTNKEIDILKKLCLFYGLKAVWEEYPLGPHGCIGAMHNNYPAGVA